MWGLAGWLSGAVVWWLSSCGGREGRRTLFVC